MARRPILIADLQHGLCPRRDRSEPPGNRSNSTCGGQDRGPAYDRDPKPKRPLCGAVDQSAMQSLVGEKVSDLVLINICVFGRIRGLEHNVPFN